MKKFNERRPPSVRVVALGGGTGLSTILRGLKDHLGEAGKHLAKRYISDLTAIVTVSDDGGSSGRLRREYKVLPPGDIRNCLVALSKDEDLLGKLFQYRFPAGRGLGGHSFGNLFLTALTNSMGDFPKAVQVSAEVLAIRGQIFPATAQNVTLEAVLEDGTTVAGETNISRTRKRIARVRLVPRRVRPLPEALRALREADLILVGPGSLYTSLIPNLLVEEVTDVIANAKATRVYIANLMTQPGETQHYSVADHIRAIYEHTRRPIFDLAIVNRSTVSPRLLRRYRAEGAEPVDPSPEALASMDLRYVMGDFLQQESVVRHHAGRLAKIVLDESSRHSIGR